MNENLVYKYVTAARIDVLKDYRIRFTQPSALNDPFETLPCLTQYEEQIRQQLKKRVVARIGQQYADATLPEQERLTIALMDSLPDLFGKFFAFLSLSRIPDNLLMWSHYSDSHAGFVIGFDANSKFFAPGTMSMEGLKAVQYSRRRFVMPPKGFSELENQELIRANTDFFFTKSIDWAYEEELRMLAQPHKADRTFEPPGIAPIYLYNFPKESVRRVILGFRMKASDKENIAGLIDEQFPNVSLLQATIDPNDFALKFVPYSEFSRREVALSPFRERCQYEVIFSDKE